MLKGVLLSIILLACTAIGRALSNHRRQRLLVLAEILASMRVLRLRMLNSMEPIGILLRKADSALFSDLGNSLWEGESLAECWEQLRTKESRRGGRLAELQEEDKRILDDFFLHLGQSGREEQNELFASIIARMEEAQSGAKTSYMSSSKLYTVLGSLIGIGICVLIV